MSRRTEAICCSPLQFKLNSNEIDRIDTIYQFTLKKFQKKITLEEISKVADLVPHSFCRYFKSRIKKTFSKFLIGVRISHACKLISETNKSVAQICYESGYKNVSNLIDTLSQLPTRPL